MINMTNELVKYIQKRAQNEIPIKVLEKAELCFLDYIGVTYAGAKYNYEHFNMADVDQGNSTVIGFDHKANTSSAAFLNGFNSHQIELDDGHRFGMIHLGGAIISAIFSVAQRESIQYEQMLKGIVLGYEAATRVALAMQPGHKKLGFHTSGTCGTIGAAVGIAVALKYNDDKLKTTISAAATSAAGLLEIQEDGSELKPYNIGHAAFSGVNAAFTGKSAFATPEDILNGDRGMLRLLSNEMDIEKLIEETDYFEIERIYVKPYAACRHCHPGMEAIIELKKQYNIAVDDIKSVEIDTYRLAVKGHNHKEIKGTTSAKLSIPFSVATAYVLGKGGLKAFENENIENKTILDLAQKIDVVENEEFSELSKQKRIAEVALKDINNNVYVKRIDYAKGDPENPMSKKEIEDKFMELMEWSNEKTKAEKILEIINSNSKERIFKEI